MLTTKRILLKDRQYKKDNLLSNSNGDGKDFKSTADLLQAIYGEAQDAIILFSTKGDLRIECNFKAYEFLEIDSKDVLSNIEIFKYLKESLKIGKGDNILYSIIDSGVWNGEVKFETKGGNVLWGDVAIRIVKIKDNEYYLTRIVNINNKKIAEKELIESAKEYRELFEYAHDAIIVFEPENEIVLDVNSQACKIYGFSKSEFVGLSLKTISKDSEKGEKLVRTILEEGEKKQINTTHYKKDGSALLLEINAAKMDYRGKPAIIIVCRDITERIRSEKQLLKTQLRLAHILNNLPHIVLYETGGNNEFMSENVVDLLGFPAEKFQGNKNFFRSLIHPDDIYNVKRNRIAWRNIGETGILKNEFRCRKENGDYIWLEDNKIQIKDDSDFKYTMGVLVNITDRKK